eukprot:g3677.t1
MKFFNKKRREADGMFTMEFPSGPLGIFLSPGIGRRSAIVRGVRSKKLQTKIKRNLLLVKINDTNTVDLSFEETIKKIKETAKQKRSLTFRKLTEDELKAFAVEALQATTESKAVSILQNFTRKRFRQVIEVEVMPGPLGTLLIPSTVGTIVRAFRSMEGNYLKRQGVRRNMKVERVNGEDVTSQPYLETMKLLKSLRVEKRKILFRKLTKNELRLLSLEAFQLTKESRAISMLQKFIRKRSQQKKKDVEKILDNSAERKNIEVQAERKEKEEQGKKDMVDNGIALNKESKRKEEIIDNEKIVNQDVTRKEEQSIHNEKTKNNAHAERKNIKNVTRKEEQRKEEIFDNEKIVDKDIKRKEEPRKEEMIDNEEILNKNTEGNEEQRKEEIVDNEKTLGNHETEKKQKDKIDKKAKNEAERQLKRIAGEKNTGAIIGAETKHKPLEKTKSIIEPKKMEEIAEARTKEIEKSNDNKTAENVERRLKGELEQKPKRKCANPGGEEAAEKEAKKSIPEQKERKKLETGKKMPETTDQPKRTKNIGAEQATTTKMGEFSDHALKEAVMEKYGLEPEQKAEGKGKVEATRKQFQLSSAKSKVRENKAIIKNDQKSLETQTYSEATKRKNEELSTTSLNILEKDLMETKGPKIPSFHEQERMKKKSAFANRLRERVDSAIKVSLNWIDTDNTRENQKKCNENSTLNSEHSNISNNRNQTQLFKVIDWKHQDDEIMNRCRRAPSFFREWCCTMCQISLPLSLAPSGEMCDLCCLSKVQMKALAVRPERSIKQQVIEEDNQLKREIARILNVGSPKFVPLAEDKTSDLHVSRKGWWKCKLCGLSIVGNLAPNNAYCEVCKSEKFFTKKERNRNSSATKDAEFIREEVFVNRLKKKEFENLIDELNLLQQASSKKPALKNQYRLRLWRCSKCDLKIPAVIAPKLGRCALCLPKKKRRLHRIAETVMIPQALKRI